MINWKNIGAYLLVFILIHMSSAASTVSLSNVALAGFSMLVIGLAAYRRVGVDKHFYTFTFIYVSLAFFYMMQFGWLNITSSLRLYLKVLFAYFTIKLVGWRFMHISEDIIAKLAALSLPLFIIQLIAPDFIMQANGFLEFIVPQVDKGPNVDYSNSFLFTVNPWGLDRNSGFMWEPGAFAAMLSVGMFLNMMIRGFSFNWRLIVMLVAIFSTTSSMGYMLVGLLGVFWLMNKGLKSQILSLPIFVGLMVFLFTLPSVREKAEDRVNNWDKTINNQDDYADDREGISVGRIASFYLDWQDLKNYPLIGYGQQQSERTTGRYIHLVRANGLSDYMARFGALGMVFLVLNLSLTFYRFRGMSGGKGVWMGSILIMTLAFSNPVLMTPFFLAFQFYYIAIHASRQHEEQNEAYVQNSSSHTYA